MDIHRRQFLRHSLVVLGTTTAAGAVCRGILAASDTRPSDLPATSPAGPIHDHMMMDMPVEHAPGASGAAARQGIPGRKWIMVIDLAKCDGCGHCKVACSKMHFVPPDREWIKVLRMRESEETAPYFF